MGKGINLSFTKSLAEFDALLEEAIEAVTVKEVSVAHELEETNLSKFQVGKYVYIGNDDEEEDDDEANVFWVGLGWEENENREALIWLEFDENTCPAECWDKIKELVGTSGKYYHKADSEFAQEFMNTWIHFFLKDEYLKKFYDEKVDINVQKEILTGFINEVMDKI